ncbi:hypothetical protein JYK02_37890 [Corallococcus macrosporus]|uniref:Uncharacterized protein n=1 Tax=Corallococcus macrosporus TaxID=35 RepID=A0ABS3DPR9_9BACT|nr:hypothetical protein [Corallococcus macrosporus]MBN8233304.1 hypothetical protein [Corallococcus macrosporus]
MPVPANPTLPTSNPNSLYTTIVNTTPNTLNVVISTPDSTQLLSLSNNGVLGPAGSATDTVTVMSQYYGDNTVNIGLFDPNYSESASVASFFAHQHDETGYRNPVPWADTFNFVDGYYFVGQPSAQQGQLKVTLGRNSTAK